MGTVGRMNAHAQERITPQDPEERSVPGTTDRASPPISDAVNNRSRSKLSARTQVAHRTQPCGVFHSGITRGALRFHAKQPGWRDKTARLQTMCAKFILGSRDSPQSFVIIKIVKFTFVLRVKPRQEFIAQAFL
jgi:hypothetical protein